MKAYEAKKLDWPSQGTRLRPKVETIVIVSIEGHNRTSRLRDGSSDGDLFRPTSAGRRSKVEPCNPKGRLLSQRPPKCIAWTKRMKRVPETARRSQRTFGLVGQSMCSIPFGTSRRSILPGASRRGACRWQLVFLALETQSRAQANPKREKETHRVIRSTATNSQGARAGPMETNHPSAPRGFKP